LTRYGDLLLLIHGKGSAGQLVQCHRLAELSLGSEGNSPIATCACDMQVNTFTLQRVALYGTIKQMQRLVVLTQFVVDHSRIDIDLPRAYMFAMAHEDFARLLSITQRLGCAIELHTGADAAKAGTGPSNLIPYRE